MPDTTPMTKAAAMATKREKKRSELTCRATLPET